MAPTASWSAPHRSRRALHSNGCFGEAPLCCRCGGPCHRLGMERNTLLSHCGEGQRPSRCLLAPDSTGTSIPGEWRACLPPRPERSPTGEMRRRADLRSTRRGGGASSDRQSSNCENEPSDIVGSKREVQTMPEDERATSANQELTTKIVAAYVRRNQLAAVDLSALISTVYQALGRLGAPATEPTSERAPAVPIRRSITPNAVVCLDCGWRGQMLRRHLAAVHGLSVEQYRASWKLPADHAMTAPAYSARRSTLAKQIGLGRTRKTSAEMTPVSDAPARVPKRSSREARSARRNRPQRPTKTST
jgi:predicted transcriptional regulator